VCVVLHWQAFDGSCEENKLSGFAHAPRRSSVVMWLRDGALIDFKQILFRLVGY